MKRTLLFIFLFTAYFCHAQNYQCLQSGVKHYFTNENGYLRGIRIDSARLSGTDSVFYPFHTGRNFTGIVTDTNGSSWLGKKVIKQTDGTFFFRNYASDTVIVKTGVNV